MTQCFLPLTSSSSKHDWGERLEGLAWIPSSEEINPTKFPQLYPTGEPLPPHGGIQRLDSMISE
ncbi:RBP1A protein, partial [Catharus fuscescens]|nr:RBP1A protein [Catharus fuscescens]